MLGLLQLVKGIRIKRGRLLSPSGTEYNGFSVTIGSITDPAEIERRYDDIENILKDNCLPFKVHEEKTPSGTFKSFTVET